MQYRAAAWSTYSNQSSLRNTVPTVDLDLSRLASVAHTPVYRAVCSAQDSTVQAKPEPRPCHRPSSALNLFACKWRTRTIRQLCYLHIIQPHDPTAISVYIASNIAFPVESL